MPDPLEQQCRIAGRALCWTWVGFAATGVATEVAKRAPGSWPAFIAHVAGWAVLLAAAALTVRWWIGRRP